MEDEAEKGRIEAGRGEEGVKDPTRKLQGTKEKELYRKVLRILKALGNDILPESKVRKNDARRYIPNDTRAELLKEKAVQIVLLMRGA